MAARRALRISGIVLLVAMLVVIGGVAAGVAWLGTTEAGLQWLLREAERRSGDALTVQGVTGTLFSTVHLDDLAYGAGDTSVYATDVTVRIDPRALARLALHVEPLHVGTLRITAAENTASPQQAPPQNVGVPIPVEANDVRIGRIDYCAASGCLGFDGLRLAYSGGRGGHEVRDLAVRTPWGDVTGDAKVGAAAPFALDVNATFKGAGDLERIAAAVRARGDSERIDASVEGTAYDAPVTVDATVATRSDDWLERARVTARDVDVRALVPSLPATRLSATVNARGGSAGRFAGDASVTNAAAGRIDEGRVPVTSARGGFTYAPSGIDLRALRIEAAGGRITGEGHLAGAASRWNVALEAIDLQRALSTLPQTSLGGTAKADVTADVQHFDVDLRDRHVSLAAAGERRGDTVRIVRALARAGTGEVNASGAIDLAGARRFDVKATLAKLDPAAFDARLPAAVLNGRVDASGTLAPEWSVASRFAFDPSTLRGYRFEAQGRASATATRISDADVTLRVGDNRASARGALGRPNDRLHVSLDLRRLAQLDPRVAGRVSGTADVRGRFDAPEVAFDLRGDALRALDRYGARSVALRGGGTLRSHDVTARVVAPELDVDLDTRVAGSLDPAATRWTGRVLSLANRGRIPARIDAPVAVDASPERVEVGELQGEVLGGRIAVRRVAWTPASIETAGEMTRFPVGPVLSLLGRPEGRSSDLRLSGAWRIAASPRLQGEAYIERVGGDVALPDGEGPIRAIGLETLRLNATVKDDRVAVRANVVTARLGRAAAEVRVTPPGNAPPMSFPPASTLAGHVDASLASLESLAPLVGDAVVFAGKAGGAVDLAGTLGEPIVTGQASVSELRVEVPSYGVALRAGRFDARIGRDAIDVDGAIEAAAGGRFVVKGRGSRANAAASSDVSWRAESFKVFNLPDRRITLTGNGTLSARAGRIKLDGSLGVDEGYIFFGGRKQVKLGDDVIVDGEEKTISKEGGGPMRSPIDLDLRVDAGRKLRVVGAGLDALLRGAVRLRADMGGPVRASGTIETDRGTFIAFGTPLSIERGRLIFDGPIDNPALDLRAMRKNQAVEAGVEVRGTVQAPTVTLVSNQAVSDQEKLSWLVLGRGLAAASVSDLALLQGASSVVFGGDESVPLTRRLARGVGLDELSVRGSSSIAGNVLAIGKRLSDRLYLEFERSVTAVSSLVRLNYLLTRQLTLRLETGTGTGVGLNYGRSFD